MVSSYKLAELWQRLGYRVVVACMGPENGVERVSPTLEIHRMKDVFLKDPWNYGIAFGFSGMVRRLVKQEKPDVIVVNKLLFWTSLAAVPLRLRGHKVIQLTDALVGITWWPRGRVPRIAAAIYAWTIGLLILKVAYRVVLFHPQPERVIKRLGIGRKTQVIPTGIDVKSYGRRAAGDGQDSHQLSAISYQPAAHSPVITYIGRLESVKGVDDFLAAAVPLKKEFPQMKIQVVGWYPLEHAEEGSGGQALHPLVRQYADDVHFTGLRDDVPAILAQTDIFVLPSHSEGLSNALMEAMASACACVATEVGGNAFLIRNGVSGFLFPPADREALRAHLRRMIGDPAKCRAMGEAARARIEETFSWDVVGNQYHALFDSVQSDS